MTNREMAVRIEGAAGVESAQERFSNQIEVRCAPDAVVGLLSYLKATGFEHLSNVTAVDWIEEGGFEIVYNLFSYSHRLHATVKARVERALPRIATIHELWPQAQVYDREVHEFSASISSATLTFHPSSCTTGRTSRPFARTSIPRSTPAAPTECWRTTAKRSSPHDHNA